MKRLIIFIAAILVNFIAQSQTTNNAFFARKRIPQKIPYFTRKEQKKLDNGEIVEKESIHLIKWLLVPETVSVSSSYTKKDGVIKKITSKKTGQPKKKWGFFLTTIAAPFLLITILSCLSTKIKKGRKCLIIFFVIIVGTTVMSSIPGWISAISLLLGIILGTFVGIYFVNQETLDNNKENFVMFAAIFILMMYNGASIIITEIYKAPKVLKDHIGACIGFCLLGLVIREIILFLEKNEKSFKE